MNAGTLNILSNIFFVFALIFAIIAVVLFFLLDIRRLYKSLSGKMAQERLNRMREETSHMATRRRYSMTRRSSQLRRTSELSKTISNPDDVISEKTDLLVPERDTEQTAILVEETTVLDDAAENRSDGGFRIIGEAKVTEAKNIIDI